uniref:UAP56-interacting factor n=1 Tax=Monopterus albus TaxID=43700 RepID=A0A3Q3QA80_MONAL
MNQVDFTAGTRRSPAVPDKVDMSLDDIIRLNKKEQQLKRRQATANHRPFKKKGRLVQGKGVSPRTTGPVQRGGVVRGGAAKLRNRKVPYLPGRRRGQGVITGLAARRPAALLKRVGTLSRAAVSQVMEDRTRQKTRPFIQRTEAQYRKLEVERWPYRQPDPHRSQNATPVRRPFHLRRRPLPPVQQTQREARKRPLFAICCLCVMGYSVVCLSIRWHTSTASNGILTVSIDNPTARTQPEPPTAWTLHPPAVRSVPIKDEMAEKKIPKGVPLEFDINSVGKPRFRILKDRRAATAQSSKGGRFVTVG